jgi:hypothetical protein
MQLLQWNRFQDYRYCKLEAHCFGANYVICNENWEKKIKVWHLHSPDAPPRASLPNIHKFTVTSRCKQRSTHTEANSSYSVWMRTAATVIWQVKLDDQPWRNKVNIYLHILPGEMQRKGAPLLTGTCEFRIQHLGPDNFISNNLHNQTSKNFILFLKENFPFN